MNNPYKVPELKRGQDKEYYKSHPEQFRKTRKRYKKTHPEKIKEHRKKYYKVHREKEKERHRKWRKANLEKFNEGRRRHYKSYPHKIKLYRIKRREKLGKVIRDYTFEEWKNKLNATKGICPGYERESHFVGIDKLTLDHIIAIAKAPIGLVYTINDIQPLCKSCNCRKQAKITESIKGYIQTQLDAST